MTTVQPTESVLRSLMDHQPNPVVYYIPAVGDAGGAGAISDFIVAYCNREAAAQTGVDVDALNGQRVSDLPGADSRTREILFRQLLQVYESGITIESTYFNPVLDKYFTAQRSKVDNGVLSVARNVSNEIRERQEKDRLIELSDLIFQTSLNGWFSCEVVQDEKGAVEDFTITRINQGFTRITGLAESQVVGKRYLSLFPSAKEQGTFDLNIRVFTTGKTERMKMAYQADGLNAWYDVVVSKLGEKGFLVTFADITEQVKNIEELRQKNDLLNGILSNSASGIAYINIIRDEKGTIADAKAILANDSAIRFSGIPRELYMTKTATEVDPEIRGSLFFHKIIHTMNTGEPSNVQYRVALSGKWIEVTLSRMDNDHLIIVYTDITESKEAQLLQERLLEELRRSNESLEDFTSTASHDLKEPIRKVQFFTERLKSKLTNRLAEDEQHLLNRVERATARMKLLVDDLLEYSHVNRGNQVYEVVDLNEKLRLILLDLELLITEKNATINVGPLPAIKGLRRQLQQLFQNLISNALKYSKPGVPPHIEITGRVVTGEESGISIAPGDEQKRFYLIEVKDNGIGFEQEYAERIFNIFTRLHGNSEYSGTGVGLAITKKVVDHHKGYIAAQSEIDKGAIFRVLLPAD